MATRLQSRFANGRCTPTTLNHLGLQVVICEKCFAFNPYQMGEAKPVKCGQCGVELSEKVEEKR